MTNAWATIVNNNMSLLDSAITGIGAISLPAQPGYPTVVLTSTAGVADQSRNQGFTFAGVLTQDTVVLWPNGLPRFFSVTNATTGPFVLTLGVNNGSGGAAGTTQTIVQGQVLQFQSDGTNITLRSADASALRGRTVSSAAPSDGQVLAWSATNSDWEPSSSSYPPSPTFVAPILGNATCTTLNKLTLTTPATGATLTIADGKTLTASSSLTLAGVDGKTLTVDNSIELAGTDGTMMIFPPASASVGYLNVPSNPQSTAYTTVLADSGKSIDHPAADTNARTYTIDSNANVPYPVGTCISFSNMTANVVTIAIASDTMYLAGTGSTGSRSLAQYGVATARKLTSTTWLISGTGLT